MASVATSNFRHKTFTQTCHRAMSTKVGTWADKVQVLIWQNSIQQREISQLKKRKNMFDVVLGF